MRRGIILICLLSGCALVSEFPEAIEQTQPEGDPPLIAYDFDTLDDGVFADVGRFGAYPLDPSDDVELQNGGVVLDGPDYLVSPPLTGFNVGVNETGSFAIAMWVATAELSQGDTLDAGINARIMNVSEDRSLRNVTIAQWLDGVIIRVRREDEAGELAENGQPDFRLLGIFEDENVHHHVLQVSDRNLEYWVDGERVIDETLEGNLARWNEDYRLSIGNEPVGERPWAGTMYDLQLYDRALTDDEIQQTHRAGPPD